MKQKNSIPIKTGKYKPISGKIIRELLITEAGVTICAVMAERKLLEEVGGFQTDPQLIFRGDYELSLRLALNTEVIAVPDLLVRVREHNGRITNTLLNPNEWSALPYKFFINLKPGKELEKIALRRHAWHMSEAAKKNLTYGKYVKAFNQLTKAIIQGDRVRHVLSSFYRGIVGSVNTNNKMVNS